MAYISYTDGAVPAATLKEMTMTMTMPMTKTQAPAAGHKAAKQARKPSKGYSSLQTVAEVLAAAPAATNAQGTPSAALRGLPAGLRINSAQAYKTKAAHNMHWWNNVVAACKAGDGRASTETLLRGATGSVAGNYSTATGAPGHFLGYAVRKGYLVAA